MIFVTSVLSRAVAIGNKVLQVEVYNVCFAVFSLSTRPSFQYSVTCLGDLS